MAKGKQKYAPTRCIGIDVDGTLLRRGRLNERLARWAREKKDDGWDVILWSARGREYAEKVARELDVEDCFTAIIGKPGYVVDDQGWSWTRFARVVTAEF